MSGGSFDYLCRIERYEIAPREGTIREMADRLRDFPGGRYAARRTEEIIRHLDAVETLVEGLRDVWKAVEWHDSADGGPEEVQEALAAYVAAHPPRAGEAG